MGIQCLWKTFRKFLDNGNISNLWRIQFPQLLSPFTCIDTLSFIMTSTDQSKPQFFIFLNAIIYFSHYALFENINYNLSLKDNSHFISSHCINFISLQNSLGEVVLRVTQNTSSEYTSPLWHSGSEASLSSAFPILSSQTRDVLVITGKDVFYHSTKQFWIDVLADSIIPLNHKDQEYKNPWGKFIHLCLF